MVLKAVGAILVCASSGAFGIRLVGELKEKVVFFQALKECLRLIRGEIRFGCATLPEAFCVLEQRTKEPLANFFATIGNNWLEEPNVPMKTIWETTAKDYGKESPLGKEEMAWFCAIGGRLGHLDKEMQMNVIDMLLEELEQRERKAYKNLAEKGKLYPCVGTMSGILATLLLI